MLCCSSAQSIVSPQKRDVNRRPSLPETIESLSLDAILADPVDRMHLRRFAARSFCLPTIDFAIDLIDLQAAVASETAGAVAAIAKRIMSTYLVEGACFFIADIPDGLRRKMLDTYANESSTQLDSRLSNTPALSATSLLYQAKTAISRFIRSDILVRFRESDDFLAMKNLHPRYLLAKLAHFRDALTRTMEPNTSESDAYHLWLSACELCEQQAALDKQVDALRESARVAAAKSKLHTLGLEHAIPIHMPSELRSSMRKVQDAALAGFVEPYFDFIASPIGKALILEEMPEAEDWFEGIAIGERSELCSRRASCATTSSNGELDYAAGW